MQTRTYHSLRTHCTKIPPANSKQIHHAYLLFIVINMGKLKEVLSAHEIANDWIDEWTRWTSGTIAAYILLSVCTNKIRNIANCTDPEFFVRGVGAQAHMTKMLCDLQNSSDNFCLVLNLLYTVVQWFYFKGNYDLKVLGWVQNFLRVQLFPGGPIILPYRKKVSEYHKEIPQSQTADKPMVPPRRETQQSRDNMKTN